MQNFQPLMCGIPMFIEHIQLSLADPRCAYRMECRSIHIVKCIYKGGIYNSHDTALIKSLYLHRSAT